MPQVAYHYDDQRINNDENSMNDGYTPRPIGGYSSTSERPYRVSVTTQETRQHLTETTRTRPAHVKGHLPAYYVRPTENPAHLQQSVRLTPITTIIPITHNSIVETSTPSNHLSPTTISNYDLTQTTNFNVTSLTILLNKLKKSNHLPPSFNTENIDNSIKTLARILNNLKHTTKEPTTESSDALDYDGDNVDDEIINEKHIAGEFIFECAISL